MARTAEPETTAWPLRVLEGALVLLLGCLLRLLIWAFYRIRTLGLEHIPREGPGLLVCNHVTWLDGLFILYRLPRRVRFLVWSPYAKTPFLRILLRLSRAIPINAADGPRSIVRALNIASEALKNGELVGIFAEGTLTRTGFLLPFHRGLEQILKKSPAPIIPTCLDRLWGSIFSYQGKRFFWKMPRKIPYPVTVSFGKPMPPGSKAWEVRQAIQILMADCFNLRRGHHHPAHRQFVRMACRHPFRPCLYDTIPNGRRLKYGAALVGAIMLVRRLRRRLHGDGMVGLLLPTTVAGALANIAVAFLRRPAVNLNYTASTEALESSIRQAGIRQVVTARAFRTRIQPDFGPNVEVLDLEDLFAGVTKWERIRTFLAVVLLPGWWIERVTLRLGGHVDGDLATVIFSSGSTGDPKGIMLSHHNILANVESTCQAIDPLPSDRLMGVLPFFHSFGYTVTLWLPLLAGASVVYHPDPRQAKEIGDACRELGCTLFVTTPTFLRFILRRCDKDDFRSLRLLITGAEKLPRTLAEEFKAKFAVEPVEGYGTTELSPVASANVPDWEHEGHRQIGNKPGTIGQPIPGVAAKIADPDTFEQLPPGKEGILCIYGPNVMEGYLHRPEATRDVIRDGWYITGDIAKMDEEGFITITDRLSRFSKIGGEMVPHQRVEDEIHAFLNTTERLCVVTGVPDERKGERLVVLHTDLNGVGVQQIHDRLSASGLPNLWLPSPRGFFQVPEIPILGSGKLDLQRVKKLALELASQAADGA